MLFTQDPNARTCCAHRTLKIDLAGLRQALRPSQTLLNCSITAALARGQHADEAVAGTRSRSRNWCWSRSWCRSGCTSGGAIWGRNTALLCDPFLIVGYTSPHSWIPRVSASAAPRCRALQIPHAAILTDHRAAAVALARISRTSIVVPVSADHVICD